MRQLTDILRLKHAAGLSHAKIAAALGLSKGVVSKYVSLAKAKGVSWPLPEELDEGRWSACCSRTPGPGAAAPNRTTWRSTRSSSARA